MKILFLLGICHEVQTNDELAALFLSGMRAIVPLLTLDGTCSYFGRTDNSPFAAGLTIFNLRKAARLDPDRDTEYYDAGLRAERYFLTIPRTTDGMLQCNRFDDPASPAEMAYSRDSYAFIGQYSISSCAYAALGVHWFPASPAARSHPGPITSASVAVSRDLGVVKLRREQSELVIRTGSEMTSWDRRYLGPTVLRHTVNGRLTVGAIPKTIASDDIATRDASLHGFRRLFERLRYRLAHGAEHLDGTSVGFLPVLRRSTVDYVPYDGTVVSASPSDVKAEYRMLEVHARGLHPFWMECLDVASNVVPGVKPRQYIKPLTKPAGAMLLSREISLSPNGFQIRDCIRGRLKGKTLLFSVRSLPGASIRVHGLTKLSSAMSWGSDGRQRLDTYAGESAHDDEMSYHCDVFEER